MAEADAAALGEGVPDDASPGEGGGGAAGGMDVAAMMAAPSAEGSAKPPSAARWVVPIRGLAGAACACSGRP